MEAEGFKVAASTKGDDIYGVTAEIKDPKTGKTRTEVFINKDTVLEDGMIATDAHEFMHVVLYNTFRQNGGVPGTSN